MPPLLYVIAMAKPVAISKIVILRNPDSIGTTKNLFLS